jgi:uncharacterized membrane protein YfcA
MLMPVLLLLYPSESPAIITSISLAVVFFNGFSGSIAYARMRRIEYKSGTLFFLAALPGSILGAISTAYIPRLWFDMMFGILMIAASLYLLLGKRKSKHNKESKTSQTAVEMVDREGIRYVFSYNRALGVFISIFIGFLSSFLGIGGGLIHVPALIFLLDFPVHIATATSHFVLAGVSLTGTLVHIATGMFSRGVRRTVCLAIGVLIGAQIGAKLSNHVKDTWIIRVLAIGLLLIGTRIALRVLGW